MPDDDLGLTEDEKDKLNQIGEGIPAFIMDEVKKQVGPLLEEEVGRARQFLERMESDDVEKQKQQLLCDQVNCVHAATWTYVWPGHAERKLACDDCMRKAKGVAQVMGFELGDVKPLAREIPIDEVRIDLSGSMRHRIGTPCDAASVFRDAQMVIISISNAEVAALVVKGEEMSRYPISRLWLRLDYMGEPSVVSCETGQGPDTEWVGEVSERNYIELIEHGSGTRGT